MGEALLFAAMQHFGLAFIAAGFLPAEPYDPVQT